MFERHVLPTVKLAALKAAGYDVSTAAASGLTTAVHLAAQTGNPIGTATLAALDAAEATGKPGAEQRGDFTVAVAAVVIAEAAKGSFTAVAKDAETFTGLVLEKVLASVKQTFVVSIGEALLKPLGIG